MMRKNDFNWSYSLAKKPCQGTVLHFDLPNISQEEGLIGRMTNTHNSYLHPSTSCSTCCIQNDLFPGKLQ